MSTSPVIVLHERKGEWARQLRPRLADRPVRWVESRSVEDLLEATRGAEAPIVLLDLAGRARVELDALVRLLASADRPLVLALDPEKRPGVAELAMELGATLVLSGFTPPPEVAALLRRWIELAQKRRAGWSAD